MATPRLRPGEWGRIRAYRRGSGWLAVCQFRDWRGKVSQRSKTESTEARAIRALKDKLTGKQREDVGPTMDSKTPLRDVADVLFSEKRAMVESGQFSPGSLRTYEGSWNRHIGPVLGDLAVEWLTVRTADAFLKKLRQAKGYATVKGVRSVLTEVAAVAVRYEVLADNPVPKAADIPGNRSRTVKALSAAEAADIWYRLTELAAMPSPKARDNRRYRTTMCDPMVPDLWLWMLGTGLRISQAIAVHWPWVDLDAGTARVGPNIIDVPGEGLRLNEGTSKSRPRRIDLPGQVVAMLLKRQALPGYQLLGPVFPDSFGGLANPNNVSSKKLRPAFVATGYGHVSPHWARRTLGSELDAAGLSLTDIAGRLGHSDTRTTERHYTRKRAMNPAVVAATEAMLATQPDRTVVDLSRRAQ